MSGNCAYELGKKVGGGGREVFLIRPTKPSLNKGDDMTQKPGLRHGSDRVQTAPNIAKPMSVLQMQGEGGKKRGQNDLARKGYDKHTL